MKSKKVFQKCYYNFFFTSFFYIKFLKLKGFFLIEIDHLLKFFKIIFIIIKNPVGKKKKKTF